jgi:hypothetical protein
VTNGSAKNVQVKSLLHGCLPSVEGRGQAHADYGSPICRNRCKQPADLKTECRPGPDTGLNHIDVRLNRPGYALTGTRPETRHR